jgi:hypothetical protein
MLLGFGLSQWIQERDRARRMRGASGLIYAELRACHDHAAGFLKAKIKAPLGRLPTSAFEAHFGTIVLDHDLKPDELYTIQDAFSKVYTLNRGLEFASDAAAGHDDNRLTKEWKRNQMKAKKFADPQYPIMIALGVLEKLSKVSSKWRFLFCKA